MSQCAIAPGKTFTYAFRASAAGTYWMHGHLLEQYTDGLIGPLIIRPSVAAAAAALPADDDVTLLIQDLYAKNAHSILSEYYLTTLSGGDEPIPDWIVVNGVFTATLNGQQPALQNLSVLTHGDAAGVAVVPPQTPYWSLVPANRSGVSRLRFIAANSLSMFKVSIDHVNMQVVEIDGVAISPPLVVSQFRINVAQRVVVLVDWSQVPLDINATALHVVAMPDMYASHFAETPVYSSVVTGGLDIQWVGAIILDAAAPTLAAELTALNSTLVPAPGPTYLYDTNLLAATPADPLPPPTPTHLLYLEIFFSEDADGVNVAHFNGVSHAHGAYVMPPTMLGQTVAGTGPTRADTPAAANFFATVPQPLGADPAAWPSQLLPIYSNGQGAQYLLPPGAVVTIFINNTDGGEHPLHFHGHSFWVVATSEQPALLYNRSAVLRRDVVSVPAEGWAQIVLIADNPGVWLVHCHIEWHMAAGLMLEFFEASGGLVGMQPPAGHLAACGLPTQASPTPAPAARAVRAAFQGAIPSTGDAAAAMASGHTDYALRSAVAARAGVSIDAVYISNITSQAAARAQRARGLAAASTTVRWQVRLLVVDSASATAAAVAVAAMTSADLAATSAALSASAPGNAGSTMSLTAGSVTVVCSDGTVTSCVLSTPAAADNSLSTGAAVGITIACCIVGGVLIAVAAVVISKRLRADRRAAAPHKSLTEAATVPAAAAAANGESPTTRSAMPPTPAPGGGDMPAAAQQQLPTSGPSPADRAATLLYARAPSI